MISIIHLGASGAVGTEVLKVLQQEKRVSMYTLLGRRILEGLPDSIFQKEISIFEPDSYDEYIEGHDVAICTLGVGEPSKLSRDDFIKIDKQAVINFGKSCKQHGVKHFQLLASVGIDVKSSSFYLKTKGELVEALKELNFERLSIFMPSMILTPTNRYGFLQGITLKVWPVLDKIFVGKASIYKGISVALLGVAIWNNSFTKGESVEYLVWEDFMNLNNL
tara:strand:+ start:61984 stop:62646 length:663 start_codon:yes stop_codon:yes gene_type:complete